MRPHVDARVTTQISAPPDQAFDAFLDPGKVAVWMLAGGGEVLRISVAPRVGGSFSFLIRRGEHDLDHVGDYLELERPSRLAFTWGVAPDVDETSRVIIDITPTPSGCAVTLVHQMDPKWADFVPSAEKAWTKMLGLLAQTLS